MFPFHRNLFAFDGDELSVVAGALPAEAGADPPASPDVPLPSGDAGTPSPEAAAPAWTGPSRDEWEATQEQLAHYARLLEQPDPGYSDQQQYAPYDQQQPGDQPLELDPFSDDFGPALAQLIDQRLQSIAGLIDERLAPVVDRESQARQAEAEERAKDILTDLASTEGEFNQGAARQLAEALLPSMRERYGSGPRAAEMALREAGKQIRAIEQAAEQRGAEKLKNQLGTVANSAPDPGAAGSAVHTIPDARDEIELVNRMIGLPGR